jgi:hypothetical protein
MAIRLSKVVVSSMLRKLMLRFAVIFLLNYTWLIASIEIMKWLAVGSNFSTIALQLLPSNLLIALFFYRRRWHIGILLGFLITFSAFQMAAIVVDLFGYPGSDAYGIQTAIYSYSSASSILWILVHALIKFPADEQ